MKHKRNLTEVVRARVSPKLKRRVLEVAERKASDEAQVVRDALVAFLPAAGRRAAARAGV